MKCRSIVDEKNDDMRRWRLLPKGCLKFNVCGVMVEEAAGTGGALRDEKGIARALLSGPSNVKDADLLRSVLL